MLKTIGVKSRRNSLAIFSRIAFPTVDIPGRYLNTKWAKHLRII